MTAIEHGTDRLAERYRRLIAWLPERHRAEYGDEIQIGRAHV